MINFLVYAIRYGYPEEGGFPYKGYNSVVVECKTEEDARKIGGKIIEDSSYYQVYKVLDLKNGSIKEYFVNGA